MTISMSELWDETVAMIRREAGLMVPLALATIGIGSAVSTLAQDQLSAADGGSFAFIGLFLATLLSLVGNLALSALTLTSGLSVGDALKIGAARLPKMLGFAVVFAVVLIVLMVPLAFYLSASGMTIMMLRLDQIPPFVGLYILMLGLFVLFVVIRMITFNALLVDRNPPLLASISQTYATSSGLNSKLLIIVLLFFVTSIVVGGAVASIFGLAFGLIGKAIGLSMLGKLAAALAGGMVSAGLSVISAVFAALLYRKITGPASAY